MSKNVLILFVLALFLGANDILKSQVNPKPDSRIKNARATAVYVANEDVYVVGYQQNDNNEKVEDLWRKSFPQENHYDRGYFYYINNEIVAKLWKNGIEQDLSDGNRQAFAVSVFVAGNDVYVAGFENTGFPIIEISNNAVLWSCNAKLWKNGVAQNLGSEKAIHSIAASVYVSGEDVYVAGYEIFKSDLQGPDSIYGVPRLWKNGIVQNLSDEKGTANSVFVSENDVYVAGSGSCKCPSTGEIYNTATLWKNGIAQKLNDAKFSAAHSVYVSGEDEYVVGFEYIDSSCGRKTPILWKNGIPHHLNVDKIDIMNCDSIEGTANSISVSEQGDVFVAGFVNCRNNFRSNAVLWKNGIAQKLNDDGGFLRTEEFLGIEPLNKLFVSGGNLYVAGSKEKVAVYWKNSDEQLLTEKPKDVDMHIR